LELATDQNITSANNGWAQQLEIWITPWGFFKGAAANNATVRTQGGKKIVAREVGTYPELIS
jgi:hypothetical protein